jgi:hypothetical protein
MNIVFSASRLMKVSEVRSLCKKMRENPVLLLATDLKAKEELFNRFLKENVAS